MTMRSAASLALLGAVLLTILLVIGFVLDLLYVLQGLIPALRLVTSFIYAFAGVGAVVFLAYGAPVLLSGEATFAGYIKLDDTATWAALTDRAVSHGRCTIGRTKDQAIRANIAARKAR